MTPVGFPEQLPPVLDLPPYLPRRDCSASAAAPPTSSYGKPNGPQLSSASEDAYGSRSRRYWRCSASRTDEGRQSQTSGPLPARHRPSHVRLHQQAAPFSMALTHEVAALIACHRHARQAPASCCYLIASGANSWQAGPATRPAAASCRSSVCVRAGSRRSRLDGRWNP